MQIIDWLKQPFNKQSGHASAIANFTLVTEEQGSQLDYGNDRRLVEVINSADEPSGNLDETGKVLGQTADDVKL